MLTVRPPRRTEVTRAAARALATAGLGAHGGVLDITVVAAAGTADRALARAERRAAAMAVTAATAAGEPREVRLRVRPSP